MKRTTESPYCSVEEYFDQTPFEEIAVAQEARCREELAIDYEIFTQRIQSLDVGYEDEDIPAKMAQAKIRACAEISNDLSRNNEEGSDLLFGLEELIEDLLFRLETIHHERNSVDVEEVLVEEELYEEEFAQKEIAALLEESSLYKNNISNNIITCGATLSKLKTELSELIASNPRARRQSKNMGMLSKFADKSMMNIAHNMRKSSFIPLEPQPEVEEFHPTKEVAPYVDAILKFIRDQDLAEDETHLITSQVSVLAKSIEHFKAELKSANQRATEEQIKTNNLQNRLPKLEESRVRLSQKVEELKEQLGEKDTELARMNLKLQTTAAAASRNLDKPPKEKKEAAPKEKNKQAVIPKAVLKDVLQASDKELEAKLNELGSSNEAIRVVLVRKNKQIRQLEGTIIQLNLNVRAHKQKIEELETAIVTGTADAEAIRTEQQEKKEEAEEKQEVMIEVPDLPNTSPSPIPMLDSQFSDTLRSTPDSNEASSVSSTVEIKTYVNKYTGTDVEMEDAGVQTEERAASPDIAQISFKLGTKSRRKSRKGSVALPFDNYLPVRRGSMVDPARRRSSMAQSDMFGIGAASHQMTTSDLAAIDEFERNTCLNDRTVKQVDDISVLQKYIASMREQSEKGMEKVREFIAKEKTRNDAATRKLINEHEKILSSHKKEMNKIVYSIHRFKEMMIEILNGKDITQVVLQTAFKYEQSPLQLRIISNELLSSLEYEIYQALKEKDIKIRDLSGRKRLDDRDLDRRIKEREKTVFSMLDYTNEKLRKEKERVTMREQWVNKKIKTELQFEKQQEQEVQTIEKALVRFWKEHHADTLVPGDVPIPSLLAIPTPREVESPEDGEGTRPTSAKSTPSKVLQTERMLSDHGFEAIIPRLYINVTDQRNNIVHLDMAHRAGLLSNLSHKLITNIIARWLELTEQKVAAIFKSYVKFRRLSSVIDELMINQKDGASLVLDMGRAMSLHRRIRDALDLQYKKLHVELGKLSTFSGNMLEEEEAFFASITDPRALKNIIRPTILQINHNVLLKKIIEHAPVARELHFTFPHVTSDSSLYSTRTSPTRLQGIPVMKQLAEGGKRPAQWSTDNRDICGSPIKSLLVPRLLQIDTNKLSPVRLQRHPAQVSPGPVKRFKSGLPPIPIYTSMKQDRISYIPNICSMWSNSNTSNTD